ncbi:hypothetical protein SNEBB_008936 [Seison nebaliae]|nr:hypothetical protein SNEBB_008936 [Seison nebaliae]
MNNNSSDENNRKKTDNYSTTTSNNNVMIDGDGGDGDLYDSNGSNYHHRMTSRLHRSNHIDNSQNINNRYEKTTVIGRGAYGIVFKGIDLVSGHDVVALKQINIPMTEDGIPTSTIREIGYLKYLNRYEHPNIVRLMDVINTPQLNDYITLTLVFEYVPQDLASYLKQRTHPLSELELLSLTKQLLNGVSFLHMNRMIHRDIKPQNILVTNEGLLKIADFGLARIYSAEMPLTALVITLWYRPPEVLLNASYGSAVDVWSCGCIIAEMISSSVLFRGSSETHQLTVIISVLGIPEKKEWPEGISICYNSFLNYLESHSNEMNHIKSIVLDEREKINFHFPSNQNKSFIPMLCKYPSFNKLIDDLLLKMLEFDPAKRISAQDALLHPALEDEDQEQQLR